tara:strand:- start:746 stop:961 length:216 start_codon:yes stop_codon:yes gene_type:complete
MKSTKELIQFSFEQCSEHPYRGFHHDNALVMAASGLHHYMKSDTVMAREMAYKSLAELCLDDYKAIQGVAS